MLSDALAWRLRGKGYGRGESAAFGAAGSALLMTWIELGDATSDRLGFSLEDLTVDFLGVGTSVLLQLVPRLDALLDFRIQYWPTPEYFEAANPVADYSGMKHLMAVRMSGVPYLRQTPLRFLEAHFGYYSRGFRSFDTIDERRVLYSGVGFDLAELLRPAVPRPVSTAFEYYQVPILSHEVAAHDL